MVKCLALEMGTFSNYISINLKKSVSVLLTECASQLFNIHKKRMFPVTSQNNVQVVSIKYLLDGHVGLYFYFPIQLLQMLLTWY